MKKTLWYMLVILSSIMLIVSFITKNIGLTILTIVIIWYLKKTNDQIKIPKTYKKLGIKNELFKENSENLEEIK